MTSKETKGITESLPPNLIPTLTYKPDNQSTVSIVAEIKGAFEEFAECCLPILSIKSIDSKETHTNYDFHLEYAIGRGGLGQVDAAKQLSFDRRVAIKQVRSDRGNVYAEEQLRKEALIMGRLEHPAIPPIHLVGQNDDGRAILVMKFIEGNAWLEIIKRDRKNASLHKLPHWYIDKHINYLLRIGEALEFAHQNSIIHRDIKPDNVVIGNYGEVYLIDWGIADQLDKNKTLSGYGYTGTPCYASPEIVTKIPVWDIRTDIYLMGATLFHICSGNAPHKGNTAASVFRKILDEQTPKLTNTTPTGLREICSRAMEKDPNDRYTSVHEMLEDLRHFLSHGDLTELYNRTCEDFDMLKEMSNSDVLSDEIELAGTRCRYQLEQLNHSWPENNEVVEKLCHCLKLLTDNAINRKRLAAARALLKQYSDLVYQKTDQWIQDTSNRIEQLANQLASRSDELGTGIQVMLVEELAAQKKAYQELLVAYTNMEKKQK